MSKLDGIFHMKEYIIDFDKNPTKYLEAIRSIADEYNCKVDI